MLDRCTRVRDRTAYSGSWWTESSSGAVSLLVVNLAKAGVNEVAVEMKDIL